MRDKWAYGTSILPANICTEVDRVDQQGSLVFQTKDEAPDYLSNLFERLSQNTIKELRNTKTDLKPRPNALDFSLYIARQMSSIVECCREEVAKRSQLFTRLGTQHSTDVLFE